MLTIEALEAVEERVCVVIPMYRVAPYIQTVIRGIPSWVWRIVAVDDASPDDCADQALALGDPRLVVVRHETNGGVGAAVMTGFRKAAELGGTILVKMDGDNQMKPEYLEDVIRPILEGKADYAKGNRFTHTQAIARMPLVRRIGNVGLSFLAKVASGYWNVFDPTNGYLAIDAGVFEELDPERIHPRYFFETSMLVELNLLRAVAADVPMPAQYDGEISSLSITRTLIEFPTLLLRSFWRRLMMQYFVLDFSAGSLFMVVGSLIMLFGTAWGLVRWRQSILSGVPASTGTVMIAVLPVMLGFQLILQTVVLDVQSVPQLVRSRRASLRTRHCL
jgi:glycosyltransferase involved in cell wall biosynthesis